jgi:CTP:molybdopterin cytidylyltransferase MocA
VSGAGPAVAARAGGLAGVVLAAGGGSRFGGPKALIRLGAELLVERAVRVLRAGGCDRVVVVLGAGADGVRAAADLAEVSTVDNPDWPTGLASSLRAGLAAVPPGAGAAVVALVDQPLVTAAAVERLAAAWRAGAVAAVAGYAGQPRNPVLLDRGVFAGVAAAATGDTGARGWLRANPGKVTLVPCDGAGDPYDIDTPADLAAVSARSD